MGSFSGNILKGIKGRISSMFSSSYEGLNMNWLREKYYKHLPPGKERSHQLFGKSFYFRNAFELLHAFDEIFVGKIYYQEFSSAAPYIIDCGANIGASVLYIKRLSPEARVIAFEPDASNFELLKKNIHSFGLQQVDLRMEAIWKENTVLEFAGEGSMSSKIDLQGGSGARKVKAQRLRDLLEAEKVDFLKIDIEGAEYEVIMDCEGALSKVENMFIEYHGSFAQNHELTDILALVVKEGFNYYIKEATEVYKSPLHRSKDSRYIYDVQLNIFCFRG